MSDSTTETALQLPIPLKDADQLQEISDSLWVRLAVYYHQRLWGIFNRGTLAPDPYQYGEFHQAFHRVVERFPLSTKPGERAQYEGWMENLAALSLECTHRYLNSLWPALQHRLPVGFEFSTSATLENKRDFASIVVQHCIAQEYVQLLAPVNHKAVRERVDKLINQLTRSRSLLRSEKPCNEDSCRSCVVEMTDHRTDLSIPGEENVFQPTVKIRG